MAVIYGWTYANFNTAIGWDKGVEATYLLWENYWARKVEAYVFTDAAASPRFTDASEVAEIGDLINELMVQMNIYLKAESVESPLETGFYESIGFPAFRGDPEANEGKGTGHYTILNKYRRQYSQTEIRVDSMRHGIPPKDNPFPFGMRFY